MTDNASTDGTVGIIGLGYVGLPLATAFASAGTRVIGYDLATDKVAAINAGDSYIEDVSSDDLGPLVGSGDLMATDDPARLAGCDALLRILGDRPGTGRGAC